MSNASCHTSAATVFFAAFALVAISIVPPVSAGQKKAPAKSPALTMKYRERIATSGKSAVVAAKAPARVQDAAQKVAAEKRSATFESRAAIAGKSSASSDASEKGAPWIIASPRRASLPVEKGTSFVGRNGTGLGDIFEDEPNDSVAHILDDVPVNVVGETSFADDIDFFAITAEGGEQVRLEVIADRIFGSDLDSFLYVIDEDGETTLASNDDFFDGSRDSFIRFIAPVSGNHVYFIGVTDFGGFGGSTYDYVLNVSIADAPDRVEVEPNDTTGNADEIPIPGFVFADTEFNDDLDIYFIEGFAGESLIVDVDAELFFSTMDPVVELYDDTGGYLFGVDDADGLDPRFNIVLPYTGLYFLAVYDAQGLGSSSNYYSMNVSVQSGALAPRVTAFKFTNFTVLKQVRGIGFLTFGDGAFAELNSVEVNSFNSPRKPTTAIKVRPGVQTQRNDVITVVNPDGRRSNPGIID
jgi:hypothetical protein